MRAFRAAMLFLLCQATTGQATTASLDDCFAASLGRATSLNILSESVRQAEERYKQSNALRLPTVAGIGTYTLQEPGHDRENQAEARITANQPLFRGFQEFAALRQISGEVEAAKLQREAAVTQLYKDVAASFYAVLALEKDDENIRAEIAMIDQRIKDLQKLQKIGKSRLSEVLAAKSARVNLEVQATEVKGQVLAARETLAFLTGLPPDLSIVAPTGTEDGNLKVADSDLASALRRIDQRPEVKAAASRVAATGEGVEIAHSAYYPTLDLNGNYYLRRVGEPNNGRWDAQLALNVPIYSGGMVSSRIAEAASKKQQSQDELTLARQAAEQEIRTLRQAVITKREQIAELETATSLAGKAYKEEQREYGLGLVTNLDVLSTLQSFKQSQRALDRTRFALRLDLERYAIALGERPGTRAKGVAP